MNLVILGNGFDLAHNLETKPIHFKQIVQKYFPESFKNFEEFLDNYLLQPINVDWSNDDWSMLETQLGYIDYFKLIEDILYYFPNYSDENPGYGDVFAEIDIKLAWVDKIFVEGILKWLNSINYQVIEKLPKFQNIVKNTNLFVTFNFTLTLENVYKIENNHIIHPHGCVDFIKNIQYGYCSFNPDPKTMIKDYRLEHWLFEDEDDYFLYESLKQIKEKIQQFYKDICFNIKQIDEFLDDNMIDEVYVYGHKIYDVDRNYYIDYFFKKFSDKQWYISYYGENEKSKIINFLKTVKLSKEPILLSHDKFKI